MKTVKSAREKSNWNKAFARSKTEHDYYVRGDYQRDVILISAEVARSGSYQYYGGMVSYAGEGLSLSVLDGYCHCDRGQWYGPNGVWISGRRFLRYLIYRLDLYQPRRFSDEDHIFGLEDLETEIQNTEVRKEPGMSLERVKGYVHFFLVGK